MANATFEDITKQAVEAMFAAQGKPSAPAATPEDAFQKDEEETPVTKPKKDSNVKMYSELVGWDDALGDKAVMDFAIHVHPDSTWDEEGLANIPSMDLFKNREIDHAVTYPFFLAMQADDTGHYQKVMMVGPTGSGKTTTAEYYCAVTRQPFFRINGRRDMESDVVIGRTWIHDGKMEWMMGQIPKAMQKGWMVLLDEPWKVPAGINMVFQRMLEKGGILQIDEIPGTLKDKQVVPDKHFRVCFADNVVGTGDGIDKYSSTLIQDGALLNRIDLVLNVPYLHEQQEINIILHKWGRGSGTTHKKITKENATRMVKVLNKLRVGYDNGELSSAASLRTIDSWCSMAVRSLSYWKSFEWSVLHRYADDSERAAVKNIFVTVFGSTNI